MNLCFRFLFPLLCVFTITSCSNEIDVLADYEESASVYALLDPNSTWQFVKINKVFINPNSKASDIAKVSDSLYFDSITPEIIENESGRRIKLQKANIALKDSGMFANSPNYIYVTNEQLFMNNTYRLEVKLPATGKVVTAYTNMSNRPQVYDPINSLNIPLANTFNIRFLTAAKAKIYDGYIYFNYTEIDKFDTTKRVDKTVEWKILRSYRSITDKGGENVVYRINGILFYDLLMNSIPVNSAVTRRFRPCEFVMVSGNLELDNYIQASTPSIGIVQKQSEYTNITNGIGIFASRYTFYISNINLTPATRSTIINAAPYSSLGFVN